MSADIEIVLKYNSDGDFTIYLASNPSSTKNASFYNLQSKVKSLLGLRSEPYKKKPISKTEEKKSRIKPSESLPKTRSRKMGKK